MLKLKDIKKDYKVADSYVHALKGINLVFRKNEFVSILGPSGCGKTTLLNIIGGLDKYTSGDLSINGKSTKEFKDSDWDVYRNHRIGFVFQSYNLIPHQTVLGNVELALTIAGLSKEERIKRAKNAIDRVGLKDQYNKKPNQLSGGQCQRVAIARALVNEPDILLADEPTGALDTQTSIQIMELIKEISNEKLVIMVTHNPDLANQYSSRIVRLLDGLVVSDSNPYSEEAEKTEIIEEIDIKKKKEKAKMSFWTSFRLSLRNLFTKKARTALVCIAGSIGIIGVSCVLAVSSGVSNYIASMQDDMLSGNPITIEESAYDLSKIMSGMPVSDKLPALDIKDGYINVDSMIEYLISRNDAASQMQIKNNITQEYIDYVSSMSRKYAAAISLYYGIDVTNNIYTDFTINNSDIGTENVKNTSISTIKNIYTSVLKETDYKNYADYVTGLTSIFRQAPNDTDYILSQYDLVGGSKIATEANEIMIVVSSEQELTDLLLAHLGYYTQEEFINIVYRYSNNENYDPTIDKNRFSYEELLGKKFYYYDNDEVYVKNDNQTTTNPSPFNYNPEMNRDSAKELVITGILKPKADISYGCLKSGFFYTESFTQKFIKDNIESEVVNYLNANNMGSFTGIMGMDLSKAITYTYNYQGIGSTELKQALGIVGSSDSMTDLVGSMIGGNIPKTYTLSLRALGGMSVANSIAIYPVNFDLKTGVTDYLDAWNSDDDLTYTRYDGEIITIKASERQDITYSDNIALIINLINSLIGIVTTALISFTCLALVVSCFMIAIITYVSVVERVKEIGVIRSLGGSKKDVTHLFNAETFIIGLASGVFGIITTYVISLILNVIVNVYTGVFPIASLPWWQALIMIGVSVLLTIISGAVPAKSAAKKDPVVALRTE